MVSVAGSRCIRGASGARCIWRRCWRQRCRARILNQQEQRPSLASSEPQQYTTQLTCRNQNGLASLSDVVFLVFEARPAVIANRRVIRTMKVNELDLFGIHLHICSELRLPKDFPRHGKFHSLLSRKVLGNEGAVGTTK